jgi:adenylate cyclase
MKESANSSIKTILEMDLVAYSDVARLLEENLNVEAVKIFQDQIQEFVNYGLAIIGLPREDAVIATAGDNAILMFDDAEVMHKFAQAVQSQTLAHNAVRSIESAKRWFRMGAATGVVLVTPGERRIVGSTIVRAVRLEAAAEIGQLVVDLTTFDALPDNLKRLYSSVDIIKGKRAEYFEGRRCTLIDVPKSKGFGDAMVTNQPALEIPDKPSIAVLPFANMSGDPEQEYFVDGMVEEIVTALSRIRWLFVIARNSSFIYKGQAIDVKQVARELGVRYVLEGSIRKGGNRVRITAQLIDAATGSHLWADRFDGSLEDVFDLQDQVASSVAGVIEPALQAAEAALSSGRPTTDQTAYDLYLRAFALVAPSNKQALDARRLLEQAIVHDPHYGPALSLAAVCCSVLVSDGRSEDPDADRAKGLDFARRALEVAGDDPGVLVNIAVSSSYFGEDIGAMMALVDRALALNPSSARAWRISGTLRVWAGQPDIAIEHLETSRRLNPRARIGGLSANIGIAHFCSRRFDQALPMLRLAVHNDPSQAERYRFLAACYAHMGRLNEARETVNRLRVISDAVMPPVDSFLTNVEHRDLFLSGLRLAVGETD